MAVNLYFNCDTQDQPLNSSGVDWVQFSEGNDQLIFSAGSDEVADGEDTPTQQELISAGIVLTGVETTVDKYLLLDASANMLKEIFNMGNENKRYVMAFEFTADTASEPVLEIWDDDNFNTTDSTILGSGTPSQSFIRGITTTDALPGADWVGSRLAGSSSGNFLWLNNENGAVEADDVLYAQLKLTIPASQTTGFSSNPVFVVKYLGQ